MIALLAAFAAASTPSVGCSEHSEPSLPEPPAPPNFIVAGPVGFGAGGGGYRAETRDGMVSLKAGIVVEAGTPVTLRVETRGARIVYRRAKHGVKRWQDADRVIRVAPCDPDTKTFSGDGTVGDRTGYSGGLVTDRKKCVRIRVSRDGESWVARVPVGRRCR